MKFWLKRFFLLLVISFSALAGELNIDRPLENEVKEKLARELFRQVRCLICQGQSISDSNADFALDMREYIRRKIAEGKSPDEIEQILISRYGEQIINKPEFNLTTILLWFTPIIMLLSGSFIIYLNCFKKKQHDN